MLAAGPLGPAIQPRISAIVAGRTARTLANIADTLGCMAGPKGGLRSGPAANTIWSRSFQLLGVGL